MAQGSVFSRQAGGGMLIAGLVPIVMGAIPGVGLGSARGQDAWDAPVSGGAA